jgi:curli biogenesis system outer membrane secretion channel CsgG
VNDGPYSQQKRASNLQNVGKNCLKILRLFRWRKKIPVLNVSGLLSLPPSLPKKDIYMKNTLQKVAFLLPLIVLAGCSATESSRTIEAPKVNASYQPYQGQKSKLVVGKFQNRSNFQNGIFNAEVDQLGSQAKTILLTHLQQTNRFIVMDRANMAELQQEAQFAGAKQNVIGAKYVVTGDVTEFGRKQTGDKQLFGLLGKGKEQVAYAKVALNIVDVETSAVVFSAMGAGEFSLENREVIGFGGTASYDATLNGKVLDLAMREAVNNLVEGIQNNQWQP